MSFGFPSQPCSVIIGTLIDQFSTFVVQRPVCGTLSIKAHATARLQESTAVQSSSKLASLLSSLARSYAINSLLVLTGARSRKSAAMVGTLVMFASAGQQLLEGYFVANRPWKVLLAQLLVSAVETVGLAVGINAVKERHTTSVY